MGKAEQVRGLSIALREAVETGDSDWLYYLSLFADEAHLTRADFPEHSNAYDIMIYYGTIYEDG